MSQKPFSIADRFRSLGFAFAGLRALFRTEHNAWIHLAAAIIATWAGYWLKISTGEWIALAFAIGFVFAMEIVNTAIEQLCNYVTGEKNETIKKVKDLTAAAVLVSAITAIVIGAIIFIPKLLN